MIPPPPKGFTLDGQDDSIPPPPAGFTMDASPAPYVTNRAALDPEVKLPLGMGTIQGEIGGDAAFNPAAAIIKGGDWLSRVNRGITEAKDAPANWLRAKLGMEPTITSDIAAKEREFAKQPMHELEAVHPGSTQLGEAAAMVGIPAAALPIVGAMEEGSIVDRAKRAGFAYAGNKLAKAAGDYMGKAGERSAARATQNAERDLVVKAAQDEGYVLPPSAAGGGIGSRVLEGLSGKAKTEQLASVRNQSVTDNLVRKDLGLAKDAPLNEKTLQAVRAQAYDQGYKPIADLPAIVPDKSFVAGIGNLSPGTAGGAVKNPAAAEINDLASSMLEQGKWTGEQLIRDIQSLREQSRALLNSAARDGGNTAKTELGRAQKQAADMLEELAERNIIANGGTTGAVKALREARTTIAKAHNVEDALVNGSVDAKKIRGTSGGMQTIEKVAGDKAMGKSVVMPTSGANVPITVLDAFGAAGGSALGFGAGALALPASRVASRYAILSQPYQRAFVRPDYDPSLLVRGGAKLLDNRVAPALAGMYGYGAANP